jgi:Cu+-exporting ATPase
MVGSGVGASNGILIRRGEAIQRMREVTTMAFDKTGTITEGRPTVVDVAPVEGINVETLLAVAASAERGSEHPLGSAIVAEAERVGVEFAVSSRLENLPGRGLRADSPFGRVLVGSPGFVISEGVEAGPFERVVNARLGIDGSGRDDGPARTTARLETATWVWVARDGKPVGAIAIDDAIKPGAREAVKTLVDAGVTPVLLTGDNPRTAKAVAAAVGIRRVHAGIMPGDKAAEVKKLQGEGEVVAMVGDGINDAPALTQADVGIAIGSGTDIAIEAGDIVLVASDLDAVWRAVQLSRATFQKIRQNLFWAFFYNLVAIPIAMLGLLHPLIAEAAMAMSSVNVVLNAQRLRNIRL